MTSASAWHPLFPNLRPEVAEGYLGAPRDRVAEVIDGELTLLPRPKARHALTAGRLLSRLRAFGDPIADDPGGWVLLPEPELHLGARPDILDPDLAGWKRERFPVEALDEDAPVGLSVAPDWVCEVLSRSTRSHDRVRKLPAYWRHGVRHAWILDPEARTLEVFRRLTDQWGLVFTAEGTAKVQAEPFDAVELDLSALWSV